MKKSNIGRLWLLLCFGAAAMLSGCSKLIVLDSQGAIGVQQRNIIYVAFALMLLVVVPVIILTLVFAFRYRASNPEANYDPSFTHSKKLETVIWGIPIIIIIFLAYLAWWGSHALDPYKPIESDAKPVTVEVVALDWKWLFIYPEQKIATVNELAFPKDVPVNFRITADAPMNSFFIPQLGGQVYAMAGMQTQLHLIANTAGEYLGISANYSGAGFSDMKFKAIATETPAEFDAWVAKVKASGKTLDDATYAELAKQSMKHPVTYYTLGNPDLYHQIMMHYMQGGTPIGLPTAGDAHGAPVQEHGTHDMHAMPMGSAATESKE